MKTGCLLLASVLFAGSACASKIAITDLLLKNYTLKPNVPVTVYNYFYWSVKLDCKMVSENTNLLQVDVTKKMVSVDEKSYYAGESVFMDITQGAVLKLKADSGAELILANRGEKDIVANCSLF